jgi:hypothetical protein
MSSCLCLVLVEAQGGVVESAVDERRGASGSQGRSQVVAASMLSGVVHLCVAAGTADALSGIARYQGSWVR